MGTSSPWKLTKLHPNIALAEGLLSPPAGATEILAAIHMEKEAGSGSLLQGPQSMFSSLLLHPQCWACLPDCSCTVSPLKCSDTTQAITALEPDSGLAMPFPSIPTPADHRNGMDQGVPGWKPARCIDEHGTGSRGGDTEGKRGKQQSVPLAHGPSQSTGCTPAWIHMVTCLTHTHTPLKHPSKEETNTLAGWVLQA